MAAAAMPIAAAIAGSKQSEGIIRSVMSALEKEVISFTWERDPKTGKMVLQKVNLKITVALILGALAVALLWEVGNWFARAFAGQNGGNMSGILSAEEILAGPTGWTVMALTDFFGNPLLDANGNQKTASVPPTFGAAYNQMLRDFTVGGPGVLAQKFAMFMGSIATSQATGSSGSFSGARTGLSGSFSWFRNYMQNYQESHPPKT